MRRNTSATRKAPTGYLSCLPNSEYTSVHRTHVRQQSIFRFTKIVCSRRLAVGSISSTGIPVLAEMQATHSGPSARRSSARKAGWSAISLVAPRRRTSRWAPTNRADRPLIGRTCPPGTLSRYHSQPSSRKQVALVLRLTQYLHQLLASARFVCRVASWTGTVCKVRPAAVKQVQLRSRTTPWPHTMTRAEQFRSSAMFHARARYF